LNVNIKNLNTPGFQQLNLPNATTCLVLGIVSIAGTCFGFGLICGIIGLVLAGKDLKLYRETPELYASSSYSSLNAGRTCSIIGVILGGLFMLLVSWNFFRSTAHSHHTY